jgi:hypothetical protein
LFWERPLSPPQRRHSSKNHLLTAALRRCERKTPLRAGYIGSDYYDDKERRELNDVLETKRPFRWYGPGDEPPLKVLTFEREFAARMQTRFALAVTSGGAALSTAVAALEIGPGAK